MKLLRLTLSSALAMALVAMAGFTHAQPHDHGSSSSEMTENLWTTGEVRKIDLSQKKITIRHEEIKSLQMPAMTMVFNLKDAQILDGLKVGDRILFVAAKEDGKYFANAIKAKP